MEITNVILLFLINFAVSSALLFEKPAAKLIWREQCVKNSMVLNDCNWCRCNQQNRYTCDARACREVDMFGHFNDAIQEYEVGMAGHGSWRSTKTACEPGVHYRRANILCVCGEDGVWPNPVCRDIFRILHSVKVINETKPSRSQKCMPNHLYLIGCNVCHCKSNGYIDPDICIQTSCDDDDPVARISEQNDVDNSASEDKSVSEIYAECDPTMEYKLGCQTCSCLRNNRLICSNCTTDSGKGDEKIAYKAKSSYCSNVKPWDVFNVDCNSCFCDEKKLLYCTTKHCINKNMEATDKLSEAIEETNFKTIKAPIEDTECTLGTKYKKKCNTCYCFVTSKGKKSFACTQKKCKSTENPLLSIQNDCVNNTYYELNCLRCHCQISNEVKWQWCKVDSKCTGKPYNLKPRSSDLSSSHGYCEPLHVYRKGCNSCNCLSDGKTVRCTSRTCTEKPISVDIVPVSQSGAAPCPKGHSYKVECNYCFCLSNGNALCTTLNCDDE